MPYQAWMPSLVSCGSAPLRKGNVAGLRLLHRAVVLDDAHEVHQALADAAQLRRVEEGRLGRRIGRQRRLARPAEATRYVAPVSGAWRASAPSSSATSFSVSQQPVTTICACTTAKSGVCQVQAAPDHNLCAHHSPVRRVSRCKQPLTTNLCMLQTTQHDRSDTAEQHELAVKVDRKRYNNAKKSAVLLVCLTLSTCMHTAAGLCKLG